MRDAASGYMRVTGALALAGFACVWAISASSAQAQTYTELYKFAGGPKDGENPEGGLVVDKAGNLYGTTVSGRGCSPKTCHPAPGMVFKFAATGTESILHTFTGAPTSCGTTGNPACDGAAPYAGMLLAASGVFYGTTGAGGASNMGTVFALGAGGEKVLYSFKGYPADGAFPYAGVVQDSAGNLYGVTSAGGRYDSGAVFKIASSGTETLLYSFTGLADGAFPYGGLYLSSTGDLYGTTSAGGITSGNCYPAGCGVLFRVDPAGVETVLHSFTGTPDGASPYGGLIADSAGNLYGTTFNGGSGACGNGCGAVFQLSAGGATVLYSFHGSPADGAFPLAGLVRDSAGNLYGTTAYGGAAESGTVFELEASGPEKVLYSFMGTTDGAVPRAPLTLDSHGNLYGTTYYGGVTGAICGGEPTLTCGVVFKIAP